jgi:Ca-activated chloride channel family protein
MWLCVAMTSADAVLKGQEPQATFRSSIAVVPISAVVRDSSNRIVSGLERHHFEVLEQGRRRPIIDFSANSDGPVSLALLFDTSGSMALASNLAMGREAVAQLLNGMDPARDEAALFTFQRRLQEVVPFTSEFAAVHRAAGEVKPWGLTSIYDAVAETAKLVTQRSTRRRAVVVISDGADTSSELRPHQVAAFASAIDVPVFVVAVGSRPNRRVAAAADAEQTAGLRELADLTGGDVVSVSTSNSAAGMHALLATMRHQYALAIEASRAAGWYPLQVRTTKKGLIVRARHAYQMAPADK